MITDIHTHTKEHDVTLLIIRKKKKKKRKHNEVQTAKIGYCQTARRKFCILIKDQKLLCQRPCLLHNHRSRHLLFLICLNY